MANNSPGLFFRSSLCAVVCVGLGGTSAGQLGATRPPSQITLVPGPQLTLSSTNVAKLDGGTIDPFASTLLSATFQVQNSGDRPTTISTVAASCVCTAVQLGDGPPRNRLLAPGEKIAVRAYVDLSKQAGSTQPIFVWVYEKGRGDPAAAVEVAAAVKPLVTFSPSVVKFDHVPARLAQPIRLAASFDPRLLGKKITFDLVSTNPDIRVARESAAPGDQPNVRQFVVTVAPNGRVGALTGSLSFIAVPDRDGGPDEAAVVKSPPYLLACRTAAPLQGELEGNIAANPPMLVLAPMTGRTAASYSIKLTGKTAEAMRSLKVEAPNGTSAQIRVAADPLERALQISVTDAAAALRAGEIVVISGEGERLVIPIVAAPTPH